MRLGRHPDGDVVVAGLVGPRARRVVAGERVDRRTPRSVRSSTVGDDLADEQHLRALRRPDPELGVGDAARHRGAHHLLELRLHLRRARDDVDGAEQRLGDPADLLDLPVGAGAAAVALEVAGGAADRLVELGGALAVLAVGEQDRVPLGHLGHRREELAGEVEPGADRRTAAADEAARSRRTASARVAAFICTSAGPALTCG